VSSSSSSISGSSPVTNSAVHLDAPVTQSKPVRIVFDYQFFFNNWCTICLLSI
jgi:hypothetical protein